MRTILLVPAFVITLLAPFCAAQMIIVPPERIRIQGSYSVQSITLDASVRDQVADVQLSQVVRNNSARQMEASFIFPIPPDAAISRFTLVIDGKEVPARLYSKEEARRIYEGIVRTNRDPAILQYMGYGMLQTSVFPLPPHGERRLSLRYSQLLRLDRDTIELLFPLSPARLSARPVEQLRINVRLDNAERIKSIYSPSHNVSVDRPDARSAIVRYEQFGMSMPEDFRLLWHLSEAPIGATLLSYKPSSGEDGYFLLLTSPGVRADEGKILPKTVVFALDRSGSMAGQKIIQARNALRFVLNNLREGDTFNIITFDDRVESFKPELQRFNDETRQAALRFVDSISDGGSTNIDGALRRAFELIGDTGRPSYVIFLTDGLPTAGETNEARIASNAKAANRHNARLFAFGVGFDVNARLLERLTTGNSGATEYVRPNQDIESAVSRFYSKMTSPVMTDLKLELSGTDINRVYPRDLPDLFSGGQIVAVGRYRDGGRTTIRLSGRVGDDRQTFTFPAELAERSLDDTNGFVEKLWATRRVGEIISELDLKGRNSELIDELVRLSTRHGILTPYTAFLADERTDLHALRENYGRAEQNLFRNGEYSLGNVSGAAGVGQRAQNRALFQDAQVAVRPQDATPGWQVDPRLELDSVQAPRDRFAAGAGARGGGSYGGGGYAPGGAQVGSMRGSVPLPVAGEKLEQNAQIVANQALYRRGGRWVDPSVTPDEETKAERVTQFSERYFELARTNASLRPFLALPEGCTVRVGGQVYQILPAPDVGQN